MVWVILFLTLVRFKSNRNKDWFPPLRFFSKQSLCNTLLFVKLWHYKWCSKVGFSICSQRCRAKDLRRTPKHTTGLAHYQHSTSKQGYDNKECWAAARNWHEIESLFFFFFFIILILCLELSSVKISVFSTSFLNAVLVTKNSS